MFGARTLRIVIGTALLLLALLAAAPATAEVKPGPVDVVPGVAIVERDGTITFTGGGFASRVSVQLTINGSDHGTTTSTATGAFVVPLKLTGVGAQSLSASGLGRSGRVHVVTASVNLGDEAFRLGLGDPTSSTLLYRSLAAGFAVVVLAALVVLAARLPAART